MSIRVRCGHCDASYTVSDEMAGRKVRCRECDADVRVPEDDDEPAPRRRSRRRESSWTSTHTILVVVGGVLCVACLACTGVGALFLWGASKAGEALADIADQVPVRVPPSNGRIIFNQQGTLMPNDPLREGRATKTFQVNLQQGKTYCIDLMSIEMDTWLMVYDPANMLIMQNDDGGEGTNARIRFVATRTGAHTIGCASFERHPRPGGSRFNVIVREE